MPDTGSRGRGRDRVIILLLLALFLFASPFTDWWSGVALPWYFPFALWALLIAVVAVTQLGGRDLED